MTRMNPRSLLLALLVPGLVSCGPLMGNLRRDLDDDPYRFATPLYGGPMAEGGFLSESMGEPGYNPERYNAVGHSERSPGSLRGYSNEPGSWASGERAEREANRVLASSDDSMDQESPVYSKDTNLAPPVKRLYKNGMRASRADFVDESPNEGSLWASDGQTNYYFTKNKIRGVGDIITLNLDDGIVKDMALEVRHRLSPGERAKELSDAQERINRKFLGGETSDAGAASAQRQGDANGGKDSSRADVSDAPKATERDIEVGKSLEVKGGDTMLAEIVERFPNGNYKVRASKRIPYKNGAPRLMTVVGVVKGTDITEEDVVSAGKLYEYRLEALR